MSFCKDQKTYKELDGVLIVFDYDVYSPDNEELNWRSNGILVGTTLDIEVSIPNKAFKASSRDLLESQIDAEIERLFSLYKSAYYTQGSRRKFNRQLSDKAYERDERKAIQEFL